MTDKKDKTFLDYKPSSRFFAKIREAIDKIDKREIRYRIGQAFVDEAKSGSKEATVLEKRLKRIVDLMQLSFGWKGTRYSGPNSTKPWERTDVMVLFPKSNRIWDKDVGGNEQGENHGSTCGHSAFTILSSLFSDTKRTWRTGRSSGYITGFPHSGKKVKGRTLRGYKDYFTPVVGKWKKGKELGKWLYENADELGRVNLIEMSHHVVLCVKFDDGFSIIDPLTNEAVKLGVPYRLAADGNYIRKKKNGKKVKYYSGKKHIFRTFRPDETTNQRWKLYRLEGLNDDCQFEDGPLKGLDLLPIVLEGAEHVLNRVPEEKDLQS